jgi:uncharacterized membrane protein YphA (DoxX/SURF4 family)
MIARYIAIGWIIIMLVAIFLVKFGGGFSNMQFDIILLVSSFILLIGGNGRWSLEKKLVGREL